MKPAVSRTATIVALWRARESQRSAASRLFEDHLAQGFLGRRFRVALAVSRLPMVGSLLPWSLIDGHWTGSRGTVAVRTRYIDDALAAALGSGVEQVVSSAPASIAAPIESLGSAEPVCSKWTIQ
jgi:O-methyltransferase involved in polyketide biosynthesis